MTRQEAKNAMLGTFRTAWLAGSAAIAGYVPEVRWPGQERAALPPSHLCWARVAILHSEGGQETFGEQAEWEVSGTLWVQVFAPLDAAQSDSLAGDLAWLARQAFCGVSPGGLLFRRQRIQERGPEPPWQRVDAMADFTYDELR